MSAYAEVLPWDAPRPDWLEARRTGIGSSDIAGVLGQSSWASPYSVWWSKVGPVNDELDGSSEQMRWGQLLEPVIADEWSRRTGITTSRLGLCRSADRPWQLASPDRITSSGGVLEVKTASAWDHDEWDGDTIPLKYLLQVTHQMDVLGADHGHVALLLGGAELRMFDVPLDTEIVGIIRERGAAFWQQVESRQAPSTDFHAATTAALKDRYAKPDGTDVVLDGQWLDRLDERERIKADIRRLEEKALAVDNALRDAMGAGTRAVCAGLAVATWNANRNGTRALKVAESSKRKDMAS